MPGEQSAKPLLRDCGRTGQAARLRTIQDVDGTTQALLFALLGAVLGTGVVLAWRVSDSQLHRPAPVEEPAVPTGIATVLSVLRSSALVVDENDEVLKASAPAHAFGLVRANKVAVEELAELVRQVRRDGQIRETELVIFPRRSDVRATTPLHVTARVAPLSSRLVLALVEDRTRERRVEAIRRDFVANVSHELKTPVGALNLLAEAVQEAADDPEAVTRFAGRMQKESARLTRLVQQIIELSRLQSDDPLQDAQPVDVDGVIASAIDQSTIDAQSREIEVVHDGERRLAILGNTDEIALALGNLVANAVAYSPERKPGRRRRPGRRPDGGPDSDRPGHRDPGRGARADLRTVLPGGPGAAPVDWRHGARTLDRQARGRVARRRGTGVVGREPRIDVHVVAAPQTIRPTPTPRSA